MKLLLTIDYELFNGSSGGSVDNCLIVPMNQLLKILNNYDVKATIFVDACFMLKLNELRKNDIVQENNWQAIQQQLRCFTESGHEVQLHLHPQWLNATVSDNIWKSDLNFYKLSDLSEEEAMNLFMKGCDILEKISGKRPVAFRAGDYCAQTFPLLTKAFEENGIIIDSSVLRNKKSINRVEWFDYTKIPPKLMYSFKNDITRSEEAKFTEVSIPTYSHSFFEIIKEKYRLRKYSVSNLKWGDGTSSTNGAMDTLYKRIIRKIRTVALPTYTSMSLDGISTSFLMKDYKKALKYDYPYIMIMGHPKTFSPLRLELFESFLKRVDMINSVTISQLVFDKN